MHILSIYEPYINHRLVEILRPHYPHMYSVNTYISSPHAVVVAVAMSPTSNQLYSQQ